jgi:hypothetical protein
MPTPQNPHIVAYQGASVQSAQALGLPAQLIQMGLHSMEVLTSAKCLVEDLHQVVGIGYTSDHEEEARGANSLSGCEAEFSGAPALLS